MPEPIRWQDIPPADAVGINLDERPDITAPLNEAGERCPWPWEPQQLGGAPLGQYHCGYCGAMCVAGIEHPDYSPYAHPLIGKHVTVTSARAGTHVTDGHGNHTALTADITHTGILHAATFDGDAVLITADGTHATVWPALDITETPQAIR